MGACRVAPHAGAWIETGFLLFLFLFHRRSRPMRARGLKQGKGKERHDVLGVAPHAGAWIETFDILRAKASELGRAPCGRVD